MMEPFTKDSSRDFKDTAMEFRYGLMVPNMRVTGETTLPMEEESSSTLMEMFTMVSARR
jgi:hypothetical protein